MIPATIGHVDGIIALSRTTSKFQVSPYTGTELDDEELTFWIEDDQSVVLVACIADVVVGYACGVAISPKWFFFDGFVVAPDLRRCGIGKLLYAYLVEICHARGLQLIQGLVKQGEDSSLEYWLERGFDVGTPCIWVEHWIDE